MFVFRRIFLSIILLLSFQPLSLIAADRLEVEIRSTVLNIREIMSTKSPVVGVLQQGERIFVTTTGHQDWIRLDDGRGFISIHYVNILSRTPVVELPESATEIISPISDSAPPSKLSLEEKQSVITPAEPACIIDNDSSSLEISSVSKTCRKNLQSLNYEACDFVFTIKISSQCDSGSKIGFDCSAKVFSTDHNGIEFLDELSYQGNSPASNTPQKVRLSWFPGDPEQQIRRIVLQEDNCLITP